MKKNTAEQMDTKNKINDLQACIEEIDKRRGEYTTASVKCCEERDRLLKELVALESSQYTHLKNKYIKYQHDQEVCFIYVTELHAYGVGGPAITFSHNHIGRIEYCKEEIVRFSPDDASIQVFDTFDAVLQNINNCADAELSHIYNIFKDATSRK